MLCRYFQQGSCRFGPQCRYAHDTGGQSLSQGSDAPVCHWFLAGNCTRGEACRFRHSTDGQSKGYGGKAGGKGRGKGTGWRGCGGQGKGKSGSFENKTWTREGKGPMDTGMPMAGSAVSEVALTGPYLGKGSELKKLWSMPDDKGHDDGIHAGIAMGDRLCTAGRDQRLLLWRGESDPQKPGGVILALDNEVAFPAAVTALLFHAASKWLFCGLASGAIRAFRQEPLAQADMAGHTAAITKMLVHEAILLSGSEDGFVRAWSHDASSGGFQCAASIQIPTGPVYALHVQVPGGIWAGAARGISCIDLGTLQPVGNIESPARVVELLSYKDCVLAAYADGVIKVFDAAGAEKFKHGPLGEHVTNYSLVLMQHPHAKKDVLLCGQEFGYITAYDIPEFRPRGTFSTGYEGEVTAIVDMGANGLFVTCGLSGDVILWRWESDGSTGAPSMLLN
mmetsp:Transcript_136109/g.261478  ORF Transcript_136109/g.261478 Transcript_136109/m.261478 type:complete len:450 (+) Transcript_136109:107-1456(+)